MHLHDRDSYGYTVYKDMIRMLPVICLWRRSLWRQQPQLVVKVQSHYHTPDKSFVCICNVRNESYLIRSRAYSCISVRICPYLCVSCQYGLQ